jgi:dipeptidyl aminopeptidase/acylaminoacyl peptidase
MKAGKVWMAIAMLSTSVQAQIDINSLGKRPVQLSDLFGWKQIGQTRISPDGSRVVFVVREANSDKNRWVSDLYLVSATGGETVQLTRQPGNDYSPRWSPDGKRLAFLSVRGEKEKAKAQVYVFGPEGGEPEQITDFKTGVRSFAWSRDGNKIYFLANDPLPKEKEKRRKEKDDAKIVEKEFQYAHLHVIDLETRRTRRITRGNFHIFSFALSPDGKTIAFAAAPTPLLNYISQSEIYTVSVLGGPRQQLTKNNVGESNLRWSPDGRWITFTADATQDGTFRYVAPSRLFAISSTGGDVAPLMGDFKVGLSGGYEWAPDGKAVYLNLNQGVTRQLVRLEIKESNGRLSPGRRRLLYSGDRLMSPPHFDRSGKRMAFTLQDMSTPADVYVAEVGKIDKARKLTDLNPQARTWKLARGEVIRWPSRDGVEVEGILYYPLDYQPGKPVPLIVSIHGGPFAADKISFQMNWGRYPHLAAAKGYAMLFVNYRGSSGYGDEWGRAIVGNYYTKDVDDILAGVDYLVERGIADPERLAVRGWSNGGILTAWITTVTDRFKAAAPGAGDVNWISDFGNSDIGVPFDIEYFGGRPWENLEHYIEKSPVFRLNKVTTPTLILFGANDVRVPVGQGYEHFRSLKELGKAPVEFVLFPREGHGLSELKHQRTKVQKEFAWFDRYVLDGIERPRPLASALIERAAKVGGVYGQWLSGILVPETVPITADTLIAPLPLPTDGRTADTVFVRPFALGRFEVTNAQYLFFLAENPDVPVPEASAPFAAVKVWDAGTRRFLPGYDNHPVTGVTAEEARRYAEWLSRKTGRMFRLPDSREWEFAARAGKRMPYPWGKVFDLGKANSVSRWAGEETFDAAAFFASQKGKKILSQRLPTLQVGSVAANAWGLHDLIGNAWEWCEEDGQPVLRGGGWASTPIELRIGERLRLPAGERRNDVGFRVVEEL